MTRIIELPADEFPQWLESLVFEPYDANEPVVKITKMKEEKRRMTAEL